MAIELTLLLATLSLFSFEKRKHPKSVQSIRRPDIRELESRCHFSTYTVTSLGDGAGAISPSGIDRYNATTLRAAIVAANARPGTDVIKFASNVSGSILLKTALPSIRDALAIRGPGNERISLERSTSALDAFALLKVDPLKSLELSGLKMARGVAADGSISGFGPSTGGAIYNDGILQMRDCVFFKNITSYGDSYGGAIYNSDSGTASITYCSFFNNSATGGPIYSASGGAIGNSGRMTIDRSYFSQNNAGFDGGHGGAVGNSGVLEIRNSMFEGNKSLDWGGAIYNAQSGILHVGSSSFSGNRCQGYYGAGMGGAIASAGLFTASNCTFNGNTAVYGGAVSNVDVDSTIPAFTKLTNCTLSGNRCGYNEGFNVRGSGGGVFLEAGVVSLQNSIVAGNEFYVYDDAFIMLRYADEVDGLLSASSSYNIIGYGFSGGLVSGVNGNRVGVSLDSLKLGPLALNGGMTKTMSLQAGSVALNTGSNAIASNGKLYADQRGKVRVSGGRVDIGAFELQTSGGAAVSGVVFSDLNRDGIRQSTEPKLANWQVFIDQNKNGLYDAGELTVVTDSTGSFKFGALTPGTYRIYQIRQEGWIRSKPVGNHPLGYYDVTLLTNQLVVSRDFGNYLA